MVENQLIGSSVYDRSGHLLGNVVNVQPLSAGDFSMVVKLMGNGQNGREITINNSHLRDIDSQQKVMHVNLDYQEIMPAAVGQPIQLLEERLVVNRTRHKVGEISVRKVIETEMVEVPVKREKLIIEKVGEAEPLVEVGLGETHIVGADFTGANGAGTSGYRPEQAAATTNGAGTTVANSSLTGQAALTASGDFMTIRDVLSFLDAIARLPDHRCRRFVVTCFLRKQLGMETSVHEFETPETAIQVLSGLENYLFEWCSGTRLELILRDATLLSTYQTWFAEYHQ